MTNDEIILGVIKLLLGAPPEIVPRIRIAVSYEEYEALRKYAFEKDGLFAGRIRNIPMYVEPTPDAMPLIVSHP